MDEQNQSNKKTIVTIVFIIITILLAGLVFLFFFLKERGELPNLPFFPQSGPEVPLPPDSATTTPNTPSTPPSGGAAFPRLRKISSEPVAGFTIYNNGTSTVIRFQDKATGYVYDMPTDSNEKTRVSSSLLVRTYRSAFAGKDNIISSSVSEDLNSITSFVGNIATTGVTRSTIIENNMVDFSASPDGNSVFYIIKTVDGSDWYIYDYTKKRKTRVYTSPLSEWRAQWSTPDTIFLFGKPSFEAETGLYSFQWRTSSLKLLMSGNGLIANMNTKGDGIVSTVSNGNVISEIISSSNMLIRVPVYTSALSDKCAWVGSIGLYCGSEGDLRGNLPDEWYKGQRKFNDKLISYNPATGISSPISLLGNGEVSEMIDIYKPQADKTGRFLLFINKNNGSLWLFDRDNLRIGE